MRECWINVAVIGGLARPGWPWDSRKMAERAAKAVPGAHYRVHVRLKPEAQTRIEHGIFI